MAQCVDGVGVGPLCNLTLKSGFENESDDKVKNIEVDPLYDDQSDEKDIEWVKKHSGGVSDLPSDAILSCPACFVTVCIASQQHEVYKNQFRALFVNNCLVANGKGDDGYDPVICAICKTELAFRDQEEVYHFYHVLPSACH
jgi:hypothetical protein